MLVDVETFLLYSLVNTYTYRLINHLEDNVSNYDTINDTYHGGYYLNPKLVPITIKGSLNTICSSHTMSGEHTSKYRT